VIVGPIGEMSILVETVEPTMSVGGVLMSCAKMSPFILLNDAVDIFFAVSKR
jgi:hypothetical protein